MFVFIGPFETCAAKQDVAMVQFQWRSEQAFIKYGSPAGGHFECDLPALMWGILAADSVEVMKPIRALMPLWLLSMLLCDCSIRMETRI